MIGFVNQHFMHTGKHYILNWKSNQLGNSLEDYGEANLKMAMEGSTAGIFTDRPSKRLIDALDNELK